MDAVIAILGTIVMLVLGIFCLFTPPVGWIILAIYIWGARKKQEQYYEWQQQALDKWWEETGQYQAPSRLPDDWT